MEGRIIISRENIKPSSPTPDEKRIHNLSLLDLQAIPQYGPLISYYPNDLEENNNNNNNNSNDLITATLKQSLSATLSSFYPLAGRVLAKDSSSFIDCNDQGVLFVVAKFNYKLSDFLKKPDPQTFYGYLPCDSEFYEPGPESYLAMFQVNFFDCGGIAIASVFSHVAVDGPTIATFMRAWAGATASGVTPPPPDYATKSLFPRNESMQEMERSFSSHLMKRLKLGKTTTRRYVFEESAISKIRSQLITSDQRRPSRFETVSAVIWKCFMVAAANSKSIDDDNSLYVVDMAVNLRRKADPCFPEHSFGNFVWSALASSTNNSQITGSTDLLNHLFSLIRTALDKVDANLLKQMEGEKGFPGYCKNVEETLAPYPTDADYLFISSYSNFGLYDMDFGWGKPIWVSRCDVGSGDTESPIINYVWVMDTREGDGIEAWLTMEQRYFVELDKMDYHELRHFASLDPTYNVIPN